MASQGVVTYMLPVEAFVTGIEVFDLRLIDWSFASEALDNLLDFWRVKGQIAATHSWSDDFSSQEVALIPWSVPKGTLITWFNFDPGHKHFYMGHITYKWLYPLVRGVALTRYLVYLSSTVDLTLPFVTYILILLIAMYFVCSYREVKAGQTIMLVSHCLWHTCACCAHQFGCVGWKLNCVVRIWCHVFPLCIAAAFFHWSA